MSSEPEPSSTSQQSGAAQTSAGATTEADSDLLNTARMQERVTAIVMDILELDRDFRLLPDQRLDELGLDSLMSIELAEVLGEQLNVVLSPTFAMEHPTIRLMAELLMTERASASQQADAPQQDSDALQD